MMYLTWEQINGFGDVIQGMTDEQQRAENLSMLKGMLCKYDYDLVINRFCEKEDLPTCCVADLIDAIEQAIWDKVSNNGEDEATEEDNNKEEERKDVEEMMTTKNNTPDFQAMKMNELRAWVKANGYKAKARSKKELIARLVAEIEGREVANDKAPAKEATTEKETTEKETMVKEEIVIETTESTDSLEGMTMKELREYVKVNGLKSKARSKKELLEKIRAEIAPKATNDNGNQTTINMDYSKSNYETVLKMAADIKSIPSKNDTYDNNHGCGTTSKDEYLAIAKYYFPHDEKIDRLARVALKARIDQAREEITSVFAA